MVRSPGFYTVAEPGRLSVKHIAPQQKHSCLVNITTKNNYGKVLKRELREMARAEPIRSRQDGSQIMNVAIVGWAHSPFGKFDTETVESLIVKTARQALERGSVRRTSMRCCWDTSMQDFRAGFTASLVHQTSPDFRFKPATRVENACATGSAAIHQGIKSIMAGQAKLVLVVGVEQMSRTPSDEVGRNLLRASYLQEESGVEGGFAGLFGQIAGGYFQKYGD